MYSDIFQLFVFNPENNNSTKIRICKFDNDNLTYSVLNFGTNNYFFKHIYLSDQSGTQRFAN
jgi:hypothetical protein